MVLLGLQVNFLAGSPGHSAGIWVLSCRYDLVFSLVDSMHQAITFSIQKNNSIWFCSAIYASPMYSARCILWDHLISIRSNIPGPWLLLGDFNEIKSLREEGSVWWFFQLSTSSNVFQYDVWM